MPARRSRKAPAYPPALAAGLKRIAEAEKALVPVGRLPVAIDSESLEKVAILVERKVGKKNAVLAEALKIGLEVMVGGSSSEEPIALNPESLPAGLAEAYAPSNGETAPTGIEAVIPARGFFGSGTLGGQTSFHFTPAGVRPLSQVLGSSDE